MFYLGFEIPWLIHFHLTMFLKSLFILTRIIFELIWYVHIEEFMIYFFNRFFFQALKIIQKVKFLWRSFFFFWRWNLLIIVIEKFILDFRLDFILPGVVIDWFLMINYFLIEISLFWLFSQIIDDFIRSFKNLDFYFVFGIDRQRRTIIFDVNPRDRVPDEIFKSEITMVVDQPMM